MLIRKDILEQIKAGTVSLAFRCWQRPTVKAGGSLKTAIGLLAIHAVDQVSLQSISKADAKKAGYADLETLLAELTSRDGNFYRIELSYAGEDPRIAIRENDNLTSGELKAIIDRLRKLDERSQQGAWTVTALAAIDKHPMTAAALIATETGFEKDWLKTNIRKLKNLGLTISHQPGYELSPRGRAVLELLREQ